MSFPRYPRYKDSGVEWLGRVPEAWDVCAMKHLASLKGRLGWQNLRADEYTEEGPFLVTSEHLIKDRVDWQRCYHVSNERYAMAPEIQLRSGDLVMMKDGAAMGKLGYIDDLPGPACLNSHLLLIRAQKCRVANRFLYYVLASPAFKTYMMRERTGSTFFGISQESIASFKVAVPPEDSLEAIISFLDVETAKIDALIAEQQRLIELLQQKRQAHMSRAVTTGLDSLVEMKASGLDILGDIPADWGVKRLKHLVAQPGGIQMGPFGGMLLNLSSSDTGVKVYGQENTISGDFSLGSRWLPPERFEELCAYELTVGDVVLTRKGSLGNARLVRDLPSPGIADSDTIRVRVDPNIIDAEFLALLLHSAAYVATQIDRSKRGAILASLNTQTIANLSIALPPLPAQRELLAYVQRTSAEIGGHIQDVTSAIALLQERRTALISAAVTGQIDVRGLVDVDSEAA